MAGTAIRWRPPDEEDERLRVAADLRKSLLKEKRSPLVYSTLVMPLNAFCSNRLLRGVLEKNAVALQNIRVEAWKLANFHCARLFEHHRSIYPDYPAVPASSRVLETVLKLDAGPPPTAANIKNHLVLFLGKLYDILEFPTTCISAYYSVETSHLYQIAKNIISSHDEDIFNLCTALDGQGRKRYATSAEFHTVRELMWKTVFDLSRCVSSDGNPDTDPRIGRGRRKFEYMIRTNGYAVCILTSIPRELQRTVQPGLYKPHTLIGVGPGERMPLTCYSRPAPVYATTTMGANVMVRSVGEVTDGVSVVANAEAKLCAT
ncbi:hypothetical protein PHYSODRAFT_325150 [Phytophthora sojae]|uniref:Uncharacterized protein n=1 Tax=Phytophthora sojae (strain P6497) TaxID=1094619 RepID=G4Z052_PHYSP|nr:hypothetical protein PHYSODRAFT_325150 [Phytophthora sojae]EGZ23991.1 hypothetical protein PHYSODRAFT_325150 [Phytophthora sojae]|eukprot:XP_009519279.1 hypothetical protein PHYSODRAFT_325150 [Phytophthora sojae]